MALGPPNVWRPSPPASHQGKPHPTRWVCLNQHYPCGVLKSSEPRYYTTINPPWRRQRDLAPPPTSSRSLAPHQWGHTWRRREERRREPVAPGGRAGGQEPRPSWAGLPAREEGEKRGSPRKGSLCPGPVGARKGGQWEKSLGRPRWDSRGPRKGAFGPTRRDGALLYIIGAGREKR